MDTDCSLSRHIPLRRDVTVSWKFKTRPSHKREVSIGPNKHNFNSTGKLDLITQNHRKEEGWEREMYSAVTVTGQESGATSPVRGHSGLP